MNEPAAFQATFTDWRLIKGRKVVQIVFEVPLEAADAAYHALGGMPDPGSSVWCGIARMNQTEEAPTDTVRDNPDTTASKTVTENTDARLPTAAEVRGILKPYTNAGGLDGFPPSREAGVQSAGERPPVSRLTHQAGIACKDPRFWAFLTENDMPVANEHEAAMAVRFACAVRSRKDLIPGPRGDRWVALYGKFLAWRDAPELSDLGRVS